MAIGSSNFTEISSVSLKRRCIKPGSLQARIGLYVTCTDSRFTFLGSPSPQLPFDMKIALVQAWYHGDK